MRSDLGPQLCAPAGRDGATRKEIAPIQDAGGRGSMAYCRGWGDGTLCGSSRVGSAAESAAGRGMGGLEPGEDTSLLPPGEGEDWNSPSRGAVGMWKNHKAECAWFMRY